MIYASLALIVGLVLLIWSADKFIEGASVVARRLGMPPLLIGIVLVGFGTSAPEMLVSAMAALDGNPKLALGNAFGSNIANIALVLGFCAVLRPVTIHSNVIRQELPVLSIATLITGYFMWDAEFTRTECLLLLLAFVVLMGWTSWQNIKTPDSVLAKEIDEQLPDAEMNLSKAIILTLVGLMTLLGSSRLLVWGAVEIALYFEISELIIGLTIVAIGTSLPELASSVAALKKNEDDIIVGNILGSNLFNTLTVVGIAGLIHPFEISWEVLYRDAATMIALTLSLFIFAYGFRGQSRINRVEGALLVMAYVVYLGFLGRSVILGGS